MRIAAVPAALVSALAAFAAPAAGAREQRNWWDVGPGAPVDSAWEVGLVIRF